MGDERERRLGLGDFLLVEQRKSVVEAISLVARGEGHGAREVGFGLGVRAGVHQSDAQHAVGVGVLRVEFDSAFKFCVTSGEPIALGFCSFNIDGGVEVHARIFRAEARGAPASARWPWADCAGEDRHSRECAGPQPG